MEITGSVREKLGERLCNVAWSVLADGLPRLVLYDGRLHSWKLELRFLVVACAVSDWRVRWLAAARLRLEIARGCLEFVNRSGHPLEHLLSLPDVLARRRRGEPAQ